MLLTTQYLEEADQLAHDIAVIDHGQVIATGTPDALKAQAGRQVLEVTPASRSDLAAVAELLDGLLGPPADVSQESGQVSIQVDERPGAARRVRALDDRSVELAEFALRRASLDEVFLALTGQQRGAKTSSRPHSRPQN